MQKNKIKFKAKNIENTVRASSASLHQQINCKCVGRATGRPSSNGITLVALVITIIVMLLLIGVILGTVLKGDLFNIAKKASVETRASMVEEKVAEWKSNKKIDEYLEENSNTQSLEELLNDLETQQLITNEERKEIEENMEVEIGDKEILFYELPEGYVELEYLESTGTQYIDTEITTDLVNDVKWKLKTAITKYTSNNLYMGANGNALLGYTQTSIGVPSGMTNYAIGDAVELKVHKNTSNERYLYYLNETYKGSNASISGRNIFLFANDVNTTGQYKVYCRIYYSKIYINDELVRDFIPCLDRKGVPCMYDLISNKAFYNQGTGEFIAGYKN